jgi:hypothetical protein
VKKALLLRLGRRPLSRRSSRYAWTTSGISRAARPDGRTVGAEGRLSWIEPEIAALSSPASYETDPQLEYRRVKGWVSLDRRRLAVLRALIAWREGEAKRRDVPRRRVLADESALAIARSKPANEEALRRVRGLEWKAGGGSSTASCDGAGRPCLAGSNSRRLPLHGPAATGTALPSWGSWARSCGSGRECTGSRRRC